MKKNIFKSLEKDFILKVFQKNKLFKNIIDVEIEKKSPDWAKESCLVRYRLSLQEEKTSFAPCLCACGGFAQTGVSAGREKIIRGTAKIDFSRKNIWKTMQNIYFSGFNKGGLTSPLPVGYIEEINLLLYEEAPGISLTEAFEENKEEAESKIIEAAKWLVKLHSLPIKNFKKAVFLGKDGYLKIFKKIKKQIPSLEKDLPSNSCLDVIEQAWKKGKRNVIHNDFYPGNAIFSGNGFCGIDFDRTGTGPFLMDLASMSGALEFPKEIWKSGLSNQESLNLRNAFLSAYCDSRNIDFSDFEPCFRIFMAKIFLDQVHYYASFTFKGWNFIDRETKQGLTLKIKLLLNKAKQFL